MQALQTASQYAFRIFSSKHTNNQPHTMQYQELSPLDRSINALAIQQKLSPIESSLLDAAKQKKLEGKLPKEKAWNVAVELCKTGYTEEAIEVIHHHTMFHGAFMHALQITQSYTSIIHPLSPADQENSSRNETLYRIARYLARRGHIQSAERLREDIEERPLQDLLKLELSKVE